MYRNQSERKFENPENNSLKSKNLALKMQFNFQKSEIRSTDSILMKSIFICGFQKMSKFSITSKIIGDMKMNQKGKMLHLMCSLRLCSLKLHWITFLLPRLIFDFK